jgi:hypothetical protein
MPVTVEPDVDAFMGMAIFKSVVILVLASMELIVPVFLNMAAA